MSFKLDRAKTLTILKWLKLWDLKLSHLGPLEWQHHHTKFYPILPVCSKELLRSFIPQASNAFRSFLFYNKIQAMVFMVILPLRSFYPTVKFRPWFPWLQQLKVVGDITMETTAKQSQPTVNQG
jgi:hypothetical protein